MPHLTDPEDIAEQVWRDTLTTGAIGHHRILRRLFKLLPSSPRCQHCNRPFKGIGGVLVRAFEGVHPSNLNPRYCNECELFAKKYPGGAEIEIAMLFADVRGSTTLAEKTSVSEFSKLIDRFYQETSQVLIQTDGLIEKLIGDEVAALYVPGYAGPNYTGRAVEGARKVLEVTGHRDPEGPWIPVGAGVHKGRVFVGAVGAKEGIIEITALGDAANVTARLSQAARVGEIVVSEEACSAAGIDAERLEKRQLDLKGRKEPVNVRVITVKPEH